MQSVQGLNNTINVYTVQCFLFIDNIYVFNFELLAPCALFSVLQKYSDPVLKKAYT